MATDTAISPLTGLQTQRQSVWIDYMSRKFVREGELVQMIELDGLQGATSNPTIFQNAIGKPGVGDYDQDMKRLVSEGADVDTIYQDLVVTDITEALDHFKPVYEASNLLDGYVSLEVSPLLAHDGPKTVAEAKAYWDRLGRPNAMIKIPGTDDCVPAIEECLTAGLNINVTLLFSVEAYEKVALAYIRALKKRAAAGQSLNDISSVASFFVSRIDSEVDKRLDALAKSASDPSVQAKVEGLKGKAAIANAKNAYASYLKLFSGPEWEELKAKGAQVQRLLWASVGTKNPNYPDTLYIDELIGPETVSTMPPDTFNAFKDHGKTVDQPTLTAGFDEARATMQQLADVAIDFDDVTTLLLKEGVQKFAKSFEDLYTTIKSKRDQLAG